MNLKPFVNDKYLYDDFLEELDERIEMAHKQLEQRDDEIELYRAQGEIKALRSLKKLREKVNNAS